MKQLNSDLITLELAQEKDLDYLLNIQKGEENISHWSKKDFMKVITDQSSNKTKLFLIKRRNNRIGFLLLKENSPNNTSVEIIRLLIQKKYRSNGFGTTVFKLIWRQYFNQGYERIWHDVFVENKKAIKLYKSLGYKSTTSTIDPITGRTLLIFELRRKDYEKANNI